ncbi:MAG: hypothetical protein OEY79_04400 [Anaplasmataceae bacterium]|nr:hypothetical protein [Anaplasmataceae bacterium]
MHYKSLSNLDNYNSVEEFEALEKMCEQGYESPRRTEPLNDIGEELLLSSVDTSSDEFLYSDDGSLSSDEDGAEYECGELSDMERAICENQKPWSEQKEKFIPTELGSIEEEPEEVSLHEREQDI